jgi:hypothetical protein
MLTSTNQSHTFCSCRFPPLILCNSPPSPSLILLNTLPPIRCSPPPLSLCSDISIQFPSVQTAEMAKECFEVDAEIQPDKLQRTLRVTEEGVLEV